MDKEKAKTIFNLFEEDKYSEAKEQLKEEIKQDVNSYLNEKLGLNEKFKYTMGMDPKKLDDEELMDYIDWLENMKDPNPDNEDQRQSQIKRSRKELKKRD